MRRRAQPRRQPVVSPRRLVAARSDAAHHPSRQTPASRCSRRCARTGGPNEESPAVRRLQGSRLRSRDREMHDNSTSDARSPDGNVSFRDTGHDVRLVHHCTWRILLCSLALRGSDESPRGLHRRQSVAGLGFPASLTTLPFAGAMSSPARGSSAARGRRRRRRDPGRDGHPGRPVGSHRIARVRVGREGRTPAGHRPFTANAV